MAKLTIDMTDPVSQTLLIPLWARAIEQREPEPLVPDPVASTMVDRIDYDWRRVRLGRGDLVQCVVRLREFDRFVLDFLRRHPAGTVVHLGCGLDARFQRVDNGQVRWFDLDLPQVVDLRRRLLPESDRDRYLAYSAFDTSWMAELDHDESDQVLFVAEAMLLYFDEAQVKDLILALQNRFPGAELVCDVCTPLAQRIDNLHLLFMRSAARIRWAVRDPKDVETWSPGIRLVESFSYFDDPEPRMGFPSWLVRFPPLSQATSIQRYQLGATSST
ncbi:class I SAM-dependent methyltransferase [Propionicimonas sp.]|uniref:class I SAM-dependent methyltransferase n=1 Tax=Propionicimonas sp. TaxID=1955623 RepID=UPI00182FDCC2|nr:class I SAM-dependent methyltransferase [Propionicimonas sp.]MBU3977804.1 class I SAM-dependent methyltransferase [Actinomycetota bacterium]MBA3021727.1 class I SAM-dependent methyltransferase [Propionicimonas sp.]MBU3987278.1 class I SAM-dependent methyltransferase [Actinomycetota bacterium]MBU4009099.1 class I SAM-dependent methyltransferase [Actinomycetota bacterium]MBU4065751.1 class I SAM-dependent methyltransferase [Actinomycetota bacterium]